MVPVVASECVFVVVWLGRVFEGGKRIRQLIMIDKQSFFKSVLDNIVYVTLNSTPTSIPPGALVLLKRSKLTQLALFVPLILQLESQNSLVCKIQSSDVLSVAPDGEISCPQNFSPWNPSDELQLFFPPEHQRS